MLKSHPYAAMQSSTIETEPELRGKDVKAATPASTTCNGHSVSAALLGRQMLQSIHSEMKSAVNAVNPCQSPERKIRMAANTCSCMSRGCDTGHLHNVISSLQKETAQQNLS